MNTIKSLTETEIAELPTLPDGWRWVKIGNLTFGVEYGTSAKSEKLGQVPVLRMGNIQNGRFDWSDLAYTSDKAQIEKYLLNKDDVLFNRTNSPELVGKTAIYKGERPAIFAGYLIRINQLPELVVADYLNYFLNCSIAKIHGNSIKTDGVNQSNINGEKLRNYPFPLPPLVEQHRIVSAIEALFVRLDATNERLNRVPEIMKKLRQSMLASACGGRLTEDWRTDNLDIVSVNELPEIVAVQTKYSIKDGKREISKLNVDRIKKIPQQWIWINFSKLICKVKRGPSKKCNQDERGIRYITSGNLHDGKLRLDTDNKYLENFDDIEKCRLKSQDLILNCVNSFDKIGKTCVYPELEDEAIIGFNNYALELETKVVLPQFINYFCQTDDFKSQLNLLVKKAVNQVSFAKSELDYIGIPLPPLVEQQEIVRRVDALFAYADAVDAKVAAAKGKTEKLRQSILAKAFSGELVPTEAELAIREGRDYEPAEMLLERIK